jgi:hypothetical protein
MNTHGPGLRTLEYRDNIARSFPKETDGNVGFEGIYLSLLVM